MTLFVKQDFISHAGIGLDWKIECDALTDDDVECLAFLASKVALPFRTVVGIPGGGVRIANAMLKYSSDETDSVLIVDVVYTTGMSMREQLDSWGRLNRDVQGLVLFSRSQNMDERVRAIFRINPHV